MENTKNTGLVEDHKIVDDKPKILNGEGNKNPSPEDIKKMKKIRGRKWFLTLFHFTQEIENFITNNKYWAWCKEICPTTNKEHWHAFFEAKNAKTLWSIKKVVGDGHIQKARGKIKECLNYVKKDGEYKTNIEEEEDVILIKELYPWQKEVERIINTKANDRTVNWYYSIEGSKGKTQLIKYLGIKYNALIIGGRVNDIANGLKNYKENFSRYPKIVLMNLSRDTKNLSYKGLEAIKDGLVVNTKFECSYHIFNSPHLFVFANMKPDITKLSKDRWNIVNLDD